MQSPRADALVPVIAFFPGRSPRWVAESCRAGRIPGAVRVGERWRIRESEISAFVAGPEAGNTNRGIFRFADDRLELCLDLNGQPRPKEFRTRPGSGRQSHFGPALPRRIPTRAGGPSAAEA